MARRFITKLFLFDSSKENNNYRGQELSDYLLLADTTVDDLTEVLDVCEFTLQGYPQKEEFDPDTKLILEKWEYFPESNSYQMWNDWHLAVATDVVEKPIMSDDKYYVHHVTCNEASVDAQGRLVDNLAVTYKLQDVTLESKPTYSTTAKAPTTFVNLQVSPSRNFGLTRNGMSNTAGTNGNAFKWVMPTWYTVNGKTPSFSDWTDVLLNQVITGSTKTISLPVPMLQLWHGVENSANYEFQGYCSLQVSVIDTNLITGAKVSIINRKVNPSTQYAEENVWNDAWELNKMGGGLTPKGVTCSYVKFLNDFSNLYGVEIAVMKKRVAQWDSTAQNRSITFNIQAGHQYSISITPYNYTENLNSDLKNPGEFDPLAPLSYLNISDASGFLNTGIIHWISSLTNNTYYLSSTSPVTTMTLNGVNAVITEEFFLRSAPPANAYDLFNKAVLASSNYSKIAGTPCDETPKAYYVSDVDKELLKNTTIIETFFSQKNLWEIFLEIGKYIHAIPKCRFGSQDRYLVTWKMLGGTNQKTDNATKLSIYNSRSIEEYVSACSSYLTNMVQLSGTITEVVAPKSTSEDYLVYNDVAKLIVQKPIIEIVDMWVTNARSPLVSIGSERRLTGRGSYGESKNGYVFEKSIYEILDIDANASINKGLAIYYVIGTNEIVGLNYQLPNINPGDFNTEYAIKRILGTVFQLSNTEWKNIKVNDFVFTITYRTKDTVRTDQVRPDLRKYLLSTPYEYFPQHNQFNNQTDIVVDTEKFGNNVYGKLIRTGNTNYTVTEWVESLFDLKTTGDLYNIYGNLYYVVKVTNIYFVDHILSQVEYSKDFNRLSQIIGIPSEPRFYEISEQSMIWRDKNFNEILYLTNDSKNWFPFENKLPLNYIQNWQWIADFLCTGIVNYPNYVATTYKNDINKETLPGNDTYAVTVLHSVNIGSLRNTLTISWKMEDNFSAGDAVQETDASVVVGEVNTAYNALKPVRYPDTFGRADLIEFNIFVDLPVSVDNVYNLPNAPVNLWNYTNNCIAGSCEATSVRVYDSTQGQILLKDNREALKFNYNLQMITDSDRFVLSGYLWNKITKPLDSIRGDNMCFALLTDEINKIIGSTIPFSMVDLATITPVDNNNIDAINYDIVSKVNAYGETVHAVRIYNLPIVFLKYRQQIENGYYKAIALISTELVNDDYNRVSYYFRIGYNITGLGFDKAMPSWYITLMPQERFKIQ